MIRLTTIWKGKGGQVDSCVSCERCWIPFSIAGQKSAGRRHNPGTVI
jgi:hypothetical protein